ncbi:MAG: DNA-directed RNA polymerase subunit beta', partial [Candidatus Sumerlaeota bacterium]|nr:DNA-directed RNA polymerase subunit beta' [Candidatus Sumerlaeota bacterium]
IGEPGTQLTLRTFHIGGLAARVLEGWYQASQDGIIRYKNLRVVQHPKGYYVVINRTGAIHLEDEEGAILEVLPNIRYGSVVKKKDGESVKESERFVEWDPHTLPIIAESSGYIRLHDIIPGLTMREEIDSVTGIAQRVIAEHKEDRHPQIMILDESEEVISQYALAAGTILSRGAEEGARIDAGEVMARVPQAKVKSKDITGGLPRVDELLEARKPKDASVMADIDGVIHIKGVSKGTRKISVVGDDGKEIQYSIPTNRHLTVRDKERVQAGEEITDGSPNPHDILRVKGEKAVMQFIVSEVQEVYRLQGVSINDKHIEAIIRQMLKKFIVEEVGNTGFLYGQQVDKVEFFEENEKTIAKGGEPAKARPKLLGLTKASLETDSFISAASFQETTRVLTDAAVRGRVDYLHGLKENVIMGLLIPAGTGLPVYRNIEVKPMSQVAFEEDAEKEEEAKAAEGEVEALVDDLDTGFDGGLGEL